MFATFVYFTMVYRMISNKTDGNCVSLAIKPLSTNPTKWLNALKQFIFAVFVFAFADELFECI